MVAVLPARVLVMSDRLPPPMNRPPPLPMGGLGMLALMPAALPLNSLSLMVVFGPVVADAAAVAGRRSC